MDETARNEYFIRVVKDEEAPEWPVPEEDLIIGKQEVGNGFIQYWGYPKESGKEEGDLPPAEIVANEHKAANPAILIDKGAKADLNAEGYLELYFVKDGHAWARSSSNLDNLEDNISAILDFSKQKFNIRVEHFMTTSRVPREVEQKLDDLENGNGNVVENEADTPAEMAPKKPNIFKNTSQSNTGNLPTSGIYASGSSSKKWVFLPVLVIIIIFGGLVFFKGQSLSNRISKLPFLFSAPTPTPLPLPTPAPTPIPTVERSKFKVRVLNGTTATGAAGNLLETLKGKGWEALSSGNATSSAVPQTEVRGKIGIVDQAIQVMILDLSPDLNAASSSSSLKSTDKADLEVVIGKK